MLKGCLLLLVALGAALYAEHRFISQRDLPEPWIAIGVLSVMVMLLVGSIHGLLAAFAKRLNPEQNPSTWKDGEEVRISGVILPQRQPIRAPFSGVDSVLFRYRMWQSLEVGRETLDESNNPSVNGVDMAPCSLLTGSGSWELRGFPPLSHIPTATFSGEQHYPAAARVLAATSWRRVNLSEAAQAFGDVLRGGNAFHAPQHVINQTAVERLLAPAGEASAGTWQGGPSPQLKGEEAVATLCQRMAARRWSFEEQHIPAGVQVTVEGTYSANPPGIEIGQALSKPHHAIRLGSATETASREWVQTFLFVAVLTGIVTALHYAVYTNDGNIYRMVIEMFFP